jgi:multidrug efflux pump subunit AcrB
VTVQKLKFMRLPKLAIDNTQFTIVVFILLILAGIGSYFTMPRTENPSIYAPGATIVVIYPGASPGDIEQLIAIPIEEAINELEDLSRIETSIKDDYVSIGVEFIYNTDVDEKYNDVVTKINDIKSSLPDDIYSINTFKWSTGDVNILQLAFVSESVEYYKLEELAEQLKKEIEKIRGIRKVELHAFPEREVRVSLDVEKMAQMNISIDQVAMIIMSNNATIPGGTLSLGNKSFAVKSSGSYNNIDEIRNTVVSSYQGSLIYLKNIATVDFSYEDEKYKGRINGRRAIFLTAQQKDDHNIFDIMKDVNPEIEKFKSSINDDVKLITVFDQSHYVDQRINGFINNLMQGIFLVGLIIFISLGVRSAIIVILAIPFSFLIGLAFVDYSGFGLQQISIAGLVVALGLLVDNSIVMVENINRFMGMGYSKREAAINGARQIAWPIVSATVTTVLAFIPIIMMGNEAGDFIKSLPVTIIFTLTFSLLIALTLTPLAASRLLKLYDNGQNRTGIRKLMTGIIEGPYRKSLDFALKNKLLTLLIAFGLFIISVLFFIKFVGVSYFPKAELPQFMIRIEMQEGSDIEKTDKAARYVESVIDTIPEVIYYATNVGHGNPRIYYNVFSRNYTKSFAEIYVQMKKYEVKEYDRLLETLRDVFSDFPGGKIYIKEFEQGTPVQAPVVINITGNDMEILKRISADVENFIAKVPGIINVDNQLNKTKIDLNININREKANYFGVPVIEIDKAIRTCVNGTAVSKYRDSRGKEYNIVLRLPANETIKLEDFNKIYVSSLSGKFIPLKHLTNIEFKEAPGLITRLDLKKYAGITADIKKGYTLDEVLVPIVEKLEDYNFPSEYSYQIGGELENRQESFGGMLQAIIIAVILIFAVLVLQFGSFTQPLIMFVSIPLAFIGSIWALYITGNTFSFTAFVGLISLVGIVINNAIILVDYTNKLREEDKNIIDSIKRACETRFTPIILTTLTTIGGLLPLTIAGGTMWAPMGWGIIGGLITSTFLTLIIVPVLYQLLSETARTNNLKT